jgi:voltage-gated sodium channel
MGHVLLLLGLLLYVYGVVGYHLFHAVDPTHWGSLGAAIGTLFQILRLEGWVEIQARSATAHPVAWLFYGSFIVVAVFVVINLFIAVVINNLETARSEETARTDAAHAERDLLADVVRVRAELDRLASRLRVRVDAAAPPSLAHRRPA